MRILLGLLWALGGAVAGLVAGGVVGMVIVKVANVTDREGASGYAMLGVALIGAVLGLVAGVVLYGRSAPAGQGAAYSGSGVAGVVGVVAAIALGLWAFMNLREAPLEYAGAMANLELELRVPTSELPADASARWFNVEVQTAKTRPEGTVLWSNRRTEGPYMIVPVVQGPLYRSGSRVIVVRLADRQSEVFTPPMKRTPNPKADWSEWYRPRLVDPPYGVEASGLKSIVELRYRVRAYGD